MLKEILNIQEKLKSTNISVWLMYNTENTDNYLTSYISPLLSVGSYCIISQKNTYILVHDLNKDNIPPEESEANNIFWLTYTNKVDLEEKLSYVFEKLGFVHEIALSYSTLNDKNTDMLGHGQYVEITKQIKKIYNNYNKKIRFKSAERIMYKLASSKSELEIDRLKLISKITLYIIEQTFLNIKVGMSEIQIANLMRKVTKDTMKLYIKSNDIVDYEFAWENCPMVLTGHNLTKGGHTLPSSKKLIKGDTIYIDFGICVIFKDSKRLCTDMQRMGYAIKSNETTVPKYIKKVFDTLVESIELGMEYMKPGVKGYTIDKIVRDNILKHGYPNYNHATGHPVGELVHDVGSILTMKTNKMSKIELAENGVYTLEPRIGIVNGGSIEEMIQVTKFGGIPICEAQKKIYIV